MQESQSKAEKLDYSLVSNKKLSEKIGSGRWGPGLNDLGQKCPNVSHL